MSDYPFKELRGIRLSDQAVEQLESLILSDYYKSGDKLPSEMELVKMLNIGRPSIREALRILESKGILEVKQGSGIYVTERPTLFSAIGEAVEWLQIRKDSLIQLLEVREILEGHAAFLLANRINNDTLRALEENVKLQVKAAENKDPITFSKVGLEFHKIISLACGNEALNQFISFVVTSVSCSNSALVMVGSDSKIPPNEHLAILDALLNKDPDRAQELMRSHIARLREDLMRIPMKSATDSD